MRKTRLNQMVIACVLSAFYGVPFVTQAEDSPQHRSEAVVTYESRQSLGQGVTLAGMSNGLKVIVRENHGAPVATVRCFVKNTGSANEGEQVGAGLSHLLEHLVAGGSTSTRTEDEILDIVDTLGGRTNAYTSTDITAFYIDCPSKRVDVAIDLVSDAMQRALIPEDEYVREMGVVQRELEMGESERDRAGYNATKKLVYQEHPARHPTVGYLSVVQDVPRQTVIDFYKNRYVPQNMVFVVAGDVETDNVLDEVLSRFKTFRRTTERAPVLPVDPDQASPRSTQIEMEGETTELTLAWPTVPLQHPDLYPLDVASYLLTSGDSSRLTRRLVIEQPLAVSVGSASYTPGSVKGWFQVSVECRPENVEKCRKIILEEIDRLKKDLSDPKELDKVKRQKAAEHVFSQQTVQMQAESLAQSYLSTGDPLFDDQYVAGIKEVTPEEIRDAARKYFRPERLNTVEIVPTGTGAKANETVAQSAESPVLHKKLSNGLTVLLKRHTVLPLVTIQAYVKGGVIADSNDTEGLAALATSLMVKGTEKYSADEIAEYFDSIGGSFGTDSQRSSSYLRCSVLKDDFAKSLDYVYQVLFKPTFSEDEFEKLQELQLSQIAARTANPQTEILDFWTRQLPQESPYSRLVLGEKETVAKLTAQQCKDFHANYFAPENMVLAIYGDIDPDATLKTIEATFGRIPKGGFKGLDVPREHTGNQSLTKHLSNQRPNTAMVVMGYPTVSVYDADTRAALEILNSVLTGMSGRLFEELRGERLVYYVFGMEMTGIAPGYFLFMAQTRPETADEVVQRIQAQLDKIRTEGIPEEEFENARQKLIISHAMSNTTPGSQAFQAALDELYGLGYDFDKSYDERMNKVTIQDVQNLVDLYFQKPIVVTSSPNVSAGGAE